MPRLNDCLELLDFVGPYAGDRLQRQVLRERSSLLIREYLHAFGMQDGHAETDASARAEVAVLKELTWYYVINRQELATVQEGQRRVIKGLCERYGAAAAEGSLQMFPPLERDALRDDLTDPAKMRVVIDFVARLTEERAMELHRRLIGARLPSLPPQEH